ncbi:MAG: hypothetical protein WCG78_00585 [Candidatus Omnitrophota bacterium]
MKLTPTVFFLIIIAVLAFAAPAHAGRAMWVWGMSKDIVLNPASNPTAQADFFTFCAAPHGNGTNAINTIFFDAQPYGYNLMTQNPAELRAFLAAAHSRGMIIDFLSGDKSWAVPQSEQTGETLADAVIAFNLGGTSAQRFDGIHYDVEPYLLRTKENGDLLDWRYDQGIIWSTYLTLLSNCQSKVVTYNASYSPAMRFGVAIPFWYDIGVTPGPKEIVDIVDYIAVMGYRDTAAGIVTADTGLVQYAATKNKKVYVAIEASHPTDTTDFPPSTTFYEEGNAALEAAFGGVYSAFFGYSSYAGIAVHYYENPVESATSKGYECSYRNLWETAGQYKGHHPMVSSPSPRAGNTLVGTIPIQWSATDIDDAVATHIQMQLYYSTDNGSTWKTISGGATNNGSYSWNTSALTPGSNYILKIRGMETSTGNFLTGYAVTGPFTIATTVTQTPITNLYAWTETLDPSPSITLTWTPPACTPKYYSIWRSDNGATFTQIAANKVAVGKYTDGTVNSSTKYKYKIYAVYGDGVTGAVSNLSNMVIPDGNLVLDYFEGNEGVIYGGPYGSNVNASATFNTTDFQEGARSLQINYKYAAGWGIIEMGSYADPANPAPNNPQRIDIAAYNGVRFFAKVNNAVNGPTMKMRLRENGGNLGDEAWESPAIPVTAAWAEYQVSFSDFKRSEVLSGTGNNLLDTHTIGGYDIMLYNNDAMDKTGTAPTFIFLIDKMRVVPSAPTLTVSPSCDFGSMKATQAIHRFQALTPISIGYSGFVAPWTIRVYTTNGGGMNGLKSQDGKTNIPLKVWCGNFGPTGATAPPDQNDDTYWVNNTAGWFRIPEYSEMDSRNVFSWRRVSYISGTPLVDASMSNPFNIYLAADILDAYQGPYTAPLTVEYINE